MGKLDDLISGYRAEERVLLSEVRARQEALANSQRRLEILQAKIQGLQEAARLIEPITKAKANDLSRKRNRALSGRWKAIVARVDRESFIDGTFDYDDLDAAAKAESHETTRDTLRSQMSLYKSAGLVEALGNGRFRLTDAGRKAAGIDTASRSNAPNENEAPNGDAVGASETRGLGAPPPSPQSANPDPWRGA